jgi:Pentapeptide repeats (8 copies)
MPATTPKATSIPTLAIDVQTALTVLGDRNPSQDQGTVIDLDYADLADGNLTGAAFTGATLDAADLTGAILDAVDLAGASLAGANLTQALPTGTNFTGAELFQADFTKSVRNAVPPVACAAMMSLDQGAAAFDQGDVAPGAVMLADSLAGSDDPESASLVQGQAGGVLREDPGLDGPDPGGFG